MTAVFVDCTEELRAVVERRKLTVSKDLTVHYGDPSAEVLRQLCVQAEVLLVEHTRIPAEIVQACPKLRCIIFMGTGAGTYVPLAACAAAGIEVVTTPGYADRAVAEHAMAMLFAAARDIARMDRDVRAGIWMPRGGIQLRGRKVAVVGLGGIGRAFADMAAALGMRVAGWNRSPVQAPYFVADLAEALDGANVLSLHLALNERTYGLVDAACFARLSHGAILVNTARAQLVEPVALKSALASGQLKHAALDVFLDEPLPPGHEWREAGNVTLTAHAAYMTDEAYVELWVKATQALRAVQSAS